MKRVVLLGLDGRGVSPGRRGGHQRPQSEDYAALRRENRRRGPESHLAHAGPKVSRHAPGSKRAGMSKPRGRSHQRKPGPQNAHGAADGPCEILAPRRAGSHRVGSSELSIGVRDRTIAGRRNAVLSFSSLHLHVSQVCGGSVRDERTCCRESMPTSTGLRPIPSIFGTEPADARIRGPVLARDPTPGRGAPLFRK